jgi:hypothetical protein
LTLFATACEARVRDRWAQGGTMNRLVCTLVVSLALLIGASAPAHSEPGGVQWSPDSARIFVTKDVGAERWSITLNLADISAAGNIFFTDGRPPAFVFCRLTGHNHEPAVARLNLHFQCFGSDAAHGVFALDDWNVIADDVRLSAAFFAPPSETCNLSGAANGPNAANPSSRWDCGGTSGTFNFQVFGDGTGFSSRSGVLTFALQNGGCGYGKTSGGSFFSAGYSPSRDVLNLFETNANVSQFILSECHRTEF